MLRRRLTVFAFLAGSLAVAGVQTTSAAPTKITSVTFSGSEAKPTITIRGQALGQRPRANPAYHPLGHPPLCPPTPTKPVVAYGLDYGTSLYLLDLSQSPTWAAGRYRPTASELDCVGLILVRFTPTTVVFRLGAFYGEAGLHLAAGDAYRVSVNGSSAKGHVHYR